MRLPFLDVGLKNGPLRWLDDVRQHSLPPRRGVYVLLARPGVTFMYPRRRSTVFYIGRAGDLRRRLYTHARFVKEARNNRKRMLYWPMYEYAAALGCRYCVLHPRGRQSEGTLESNLLAMFAEHYRSWPIANGVGGWASLLKPSAPR